MGQGIAAGHRADIDGLRSLAILPILLFHAGVSQFSGGFIGVDVFFVISGFLITGIINREIVGNTFSIGAFYRRRFVRILPALAVVLVATLAWGAWFLLPPEMSDLAQSAAATAGFASNIFFYLTTDYFGGAAESKPLLHTWSLGVEEQFYLLYPLLLIALQRWRPNWTKGALVILATVSFVADWWLYAIDPLAAFYQLPVRAWELSIGGLLAVGAFPRLSSGLMRNLAGAAGMALIAVGTVFIRPSMPFPAPLGLIPCGGAALLIAYAPGTISGKLLSWQPLRWIGAISYSLYLWHWPLITFYRLKYGATLHLRDTVVLLILSFLAASISYYFVEQPVLRRWRQGPVRMVNMLALSGAAAFVAAGMALATWAPQLSSAPPEVLRIANYIHYDRTAEGIYQFRPGRYFAKVNDRNYDFQNWVLTDPNRRNIVVMGDSHAAQLWRAVFEKFPQDNVIQVTAAGCRPVLHGRGAARCTQLRDYVFDTLVPEGRISAVVLAGRWLAKEDPALSAAIKYLRAHQVAVTVIGPDVEYDGDYSLLLARAMMGGNIHAVDRFRIDMHEREQAIRKLALSAGAQYYSLHDRECPGTGDRACRLLAAPGVPMHFDYGHLTLPAARLLMRDIRP